VAAAFEKEAPFVAGMCGGGGFLFAVDLTTRWIDVIMDVGNSII
jgi:hypothetical protein